MPLPDFLFWSYFSKKIPKFALTTRQQMLVLWGFLFGLNSFMRRMTNTLFRQGVHFAKGVPQQRRLSSTVNEVVPRMEKIPWLWEKNEKTWKAASQALKRMKKPFWGPGRTGQSLLLPWKVRGLSQIIPARIDLHGRDVGAGAVVNNLFVHVYNIQFFHLTQ